MPCFVTTMTVSADTSKFAMLLCFVLWKMVSAQEEHDRSEPDFLIQLSMGCVYPISPLSRCSVGQQRIAPSAPPVNCR